ncbi:MAG: tRNA (adenosine(37)-N6)-threonylcarbamoyltransferase complex dimerization subunit type 1 TsaB [Paludibacteraceae bacterium]
MNLIHIETSTNVCSVAVSQDGKCIFVASDSAGMNHATMLSPFIQKGLDAMKAGNIFPDAIVVSSGPGSYTGLRIGVSTAKGLCFGYGIPLIGIDTLSILTQAVILKQAVETNALLCPMIDARRMEVYTALYSSDLKQIEPVSAKIVGENSFLELLDKNTIYFYGNGADKCKEIITHANAKFISAVEPQAENMIALGEEKFIKQDFEDTAYFEPFYLKDFQATTPKNRFKK